MKPEKRAARAGYMECASGFSCGNCFYLRTKPSSNGDTWFCAHPYIKLPVSPVNGCCNNFLPRDPDHMIKTASPIKVYLGNPPSKSRVILIGAF